jgi:signal transduction histidine kinase
MIDGYAPATTADLALENERLRAELRARRAELRACRGHVSDAIDAERRRIECDLHDGTQGRLVSLAMSLGFLEAKLPREPEAAQPIAREARATIAAALADLRELIQGIYPATLAERGLGAAFEELSARAALPVRLDVSLDRRLAADVEAAGYLLVSESLTKGPLAASGTRQDSGYPAGRNIPGLIDSRASGAPVCEALESQ